MTFFLVTVGSGVAVAVELLAALRDLLAVGTTRRGGGEGVHRRGHRRARLRRRGRPARSGGAHPDRLEALRVVIGTLLLLLGLEWLRKGTLRRAGVRARSSSQAEFDETAQELPDDPLPPPDRRARAGRLVAGKGVLLPGLEVVLIVTALAKRPSGPTPAILGAGVAAVAVLAAGVWLRRPLSRIPETELKWGVGVLLTAFGLFFTAEGLGVSWPGGDAAIPALVVVLAAVSQLQVHVLSSAPRDVAT